MPSSFTRVLPNTFGFSPRTPVSDCGTGRRVVPAGLFAAGRRGASRQAVALAGRGLLPPRPLLDRRPPRFVLHAGSRNISRVSIDFAFRLRLRSRLTLGGLTFPRKPCAFGGWASHPSDRYSFRHTHSSPLQRSSRSAFSARRRRSPTMRDPEDLGSATSARRLVPFIFGAGWLDR